VRLGRDGVIIDLTVDKSSVATVMTSAQEAEESPLLGEVARKRLVKIQKN
jgi:hypothetical protein